MNRKIPRLRIMAPKGFTDHDYAGRKLARLAQEHRLGVRCRVPRRAKWGRAKR